MVKDGAKFGEELIYDWFPRLRERRDHIAGSLSGGEQQMLAIGRALMTNPQLLLLDEPTDGLAPQIIEEVGAIITRLREAGLAVLLVEQNTGFALKLANEMVILKSGRIAYAGATDVAIVGGASIKPDLRTIARSGRATFPAMSAIATEQGSCCIRRSGTQYH